MNICLYVAILCCALLSSCRTPQGEAYKQMYAHLQLIPRPVENEIVTGDYFLLLLVEARHLDYTSNYTFIKTMAKHPSDGSKNRDVGHAWIYLEGMEGDKRICLEGGHSGERGLYQARYFDGIMNNIEYGCANPTKEQLLGLELFFEPNPVKYLWETQHDGYFQYGSGRHKPTYAALIQLSEEQFNSIMSYVRSYNYSDYVLTSRQCSTFLAQVASLGGLDLECEVTMPVEKNLYIGGESLRMWEDPCYSLLTVATPDILEKSLMEAVQCGRAQYAMKWYKEHSGRFKKSRLLR